MRLFPLDVLTGSLLIFSMISMLVSIYVLRYRGGKGPVAMMISSLILLVSSAYSILLSLEIIQGGMIPFYTGAAIGGLGVIVSAYLWRRPP
ncbi:MAG: hypothetical protein KAH57_11300 [Thermoplasmata archaeon]|nr:hypothetical protein [Thermoplasmata archaeon]